MFSFFFQAEDGIRDFHVTGVQTCALPISNDRRGKNLKVYDPRKGSQYYLSIQEIKKQAHYTKDQWDLAETEDKIKSLCANELKDYKIDFKKALDENGHATLFNKLTYFKYLKGNFGFRDFEAEQNFLNDLLKNQDISNVPNTFKTLELDKGKIKNSAPLILVVKPNEDPNKQISYPPEPAKNLYWQLYKQLGEYKKLWYNYIFAELFSSH